MEDLITIVLQLLLEVLFSIMTYGGIEFTQSYWFWRRSKIAPANPLMLGVSSLLYGVLFGLMSLAIVPTHFIKHHVVRLIAVFVAPLLLGLLASISWRPWKYATISIRRLDRFVFAALFGFGYVLLRFFKAL
ncbi:MAG: hypothetical protein HY074_03115 [Deltaproteobacteria bacterium]|nr:hypothetical protein [Deltaproteobacteria bacterium]